MEFYSDRVCGYTVRYADQGAGPAVLFIHGMEASAQTWAHQFADLVQDHRVIALDLIGCGYSEKSLDFAYTPKAFAAFIAEFLHHLGVDTAAVIGHSLGGAIAEQFARDFAERVDALILIAPSDLQTGLRTGRNRAIENVLLFSYFDKQKIPSYVFDQMRDVRSQEHALECSNLIKQANSVPYEQTLPQFDGPLCLIWGDSDEVLPLNEMGHVVQRFPQATLHKIENAGHACHEEQPQTVNALIRDYLAR